MTTLAPLGTDLQDRLDQLRRLDRRYALFRARRHSRAPIEDFNAADLRVIEELHMAAGGFSGSTLSSRLCLDQGYVCRTLKKLEGGGLVTSRRSTIDRRMRDWNLTKMGRAFAASQEAQWRDLAYWTLLMIPPDDQHRLAEAMTVIEKILLRFEMQGTR